MQCSLIDAHVTHENITPIRTHRQLPLPGPLPPPRPLDKGSGVSSPGAGLAAQGNALSTSYLVHKSFYLLCYQG